VQPVLDVGQIRVEESTIGTDGVAAQWNRSHDWYILLDKRKGLFAGFFERDG
jgi:hypothetical protein